MAQIDETTQQASTPTQDTHLSVEDAFFAEPSQEESTGEINAPVREDGSASVLNQESLEKNDERRFQYWQSEADKAKNENEALKQQMQTMQAQRVQPQQVQAPVAEPQAEVFPPPPDKPARPSGFNRSEAYEDPNSQSARYLDEVETWRDQMTEYSSLKNEYSTALISEQIDNERKVRTENIKRAQYQQQVNKQVGDIYNQVQGEYGLNSDEARSFVNDMSKPDSLSMDNLVELWRIKQGSGANVNTVPAQPSSAFTQQQRAQQVVSPMGVQPAQQAPDVSSEDSIMDSMITDFKSKNPW